jgi:hypothetical protein
MSGSESVAKVSARKRALMDGIIVEHPRLRNAHLTFDQLIEHGQLRPKGGKLCAPLIAPAQSGKSTIIESYAAKMNTPELVESGKIPVLHVTLSANATRKQFAQDILLALSEFGFNTLAFKGTEAVLLQRVDHYLRLAEVKLLVLDEFHHLVDSNNQRVILPVSEAVKRLLIKGSCPIVVSGIEEAWRPFKANQQLALRSAPAIDLSPFEQADRADMDLFLQFLASYAVELERAGVIDNPEFALDGDIPNCILEVTDGVLGRSCNLIKQAIENAAVSGETRVARSHLASAAQTNFVDMDLYERNPFTHGFAPMRAAKAAA